MKKILIILFLFPIFINAQTFKKVYDFGYSFFPKTTIEINDGYLIGGWANINSQSTFNYKIIKLDKQGKIVNQSERDENIFESMQEVWAINDTTYGAVGLFAEDNDSTVKIFYYKLNSNLQIIAKDTFYFHDDIPYSYECLHRMSSDLYKDKNNNIVFVIDLSLKEPYDDQLSIIKFNSNGEF